MQNITNRKQQGEEVLLIFITNLTLLKFPTEIKVIWGKHREEI